MFHSVLTLTFDTANIINKQFVFSLKTYLTLGTSYFAVFQINPLNAELNPIRHLLASVGACHIVHVSRIRVKN